MPERITHNDTTDGNVLLDEVTGEGICVIDLDLVMPGLAFTLRSLQKVLTKKKTIRLRLFTNGLW